MIKFKAAIHPAMSITRAKILTTVYLIPELSINNGIASIMTL